MTARAVEFVIAVQRMMRPMRAPGWVGADAHQLARLALWGLLVVLVGVPSAAAAPSPPAVAVKEPKCKAAFLTSAIVRVPHLLARDDSGVYYYVDRYAKIYGGKGYRVYVGRKGAMKQMPLTDVASDSAGDVFSTKSGDLRLVRNSENNKETMTWVKGEKRTELVFLDTDVNSVVIFKDLGVYTFLGTLCDNV